MFTYRLSSKMKAMAQRTARGAPRGRARAAQPGPPSEAGVPATTRERILEVALDLFIRKGYAETSLREIAAELGFSKAALYYHFESKQDILLALHSRLHHLGDEVLPLLQDEAARGATWERFIELLIGLTFRNRRLIEMHVRNQEALAELHRGPALERHVPVQRHDMHDMEDHLRDLLRDPAVPVEQRVRRMAAVGAIMGVLLASGSYAPAEVPDAELETILRGVVRDVLGGNQAG